MLEETYTNEIDINLYTLGSMLECTLFLECSETLKQKIQDIINDIHLMTFQYPKKYESYDIKDMIFTCTTLFEKETNI